MRLTIDVDQAQEHRLVFVAGNERYLTEQIDVQLPVDVDVLRDADRDVRGELLRKPQPVLRRGQRERIGSMLSVVRSRSVFHQITNRGACAAGSTAGRSVLVGRGSRIYRRHYGPADRLARKHTLGVWCGHPAPSAQPHDEDAGELCLAVSVFEAR